MNKKIKSYLRRGISGLLALTLLVGLLPTTATKAAAKTATAYAYSMGSLGSIDFGSKTKSGTWWRLKLGSEAAFCLNLGKTCHNGNTYELSDTYNWSQATGGEKHGYYAKIIRWYVIDKNRGKKSYALAQALMWSVAEGNNSKAELTKVIKTFKTNTGWFSGNKESELYSDIFEPTGAWTVTCEYYKKTGASASYQTLLKVDAGETPEEKYLSKNTYYRQRITLEKKDELGNAIDGITFKLTSHNVDELYSYSVTDANGTDSTDADEADIDDFSVSGVTNSNGKVAWRMTFRLDSDEYAYYSDAQLKDKTKTELAAMKKYLTDDLGLDEGVDFSSDMTKAGAEQLAEKDLKTQMGDIYNKYTLTETDLGKNTNLVMDPEYASGKTIVLTKDNSWQKNSDNVWPDTLVTPNNSYSGAYKVSVTNKYKKATIMVKKKASNTSDGLAHGDGSLAGAVFQLYSDASCTNKAIVYNEDGSTKTSGPYITGEDGRTITDYLRSGGTYYLKEIVAPEGFILNDNPQKIVIDASSKNQEFTPILMEAEFPNTEIKGTLAINKSMYDPTGKITTAEKNVTFQVYLKSKGAYDNCEDDEKDTIKTNENGYAETKQLVFGTYVIHQVDSGDEDTYLVPDFEMTITQNGEKLEESKVNEQFKAYLKIIKKDKNTEKTVLKKGTSYQIYKVTGEGDETQEELLTQKFTDANGDEQTVDTFTCDETGEVQTVDSIKSGTYRLYEVNAANGYHKNDQYIEIVINSKVDNYESYVDEDGYHHVIITVDYTNEETKGKLNIYKSGQVLTGWDVDKHEFIYENKELDGVEFTIYADGDIETQDEQFTLTDGEKTRDTWFKDGDQVGVITTGKGAEFTSECGGLTGYTMDEDGTIHVSLPLGKYRIVETKTPYGYIYPEKKEWNVEFKWVDGQDEYVLNSTEDTDETGTLKVQNDFAETSLDLLKQDEDSKEVISGAEFGLYAKNDIYNYIGEKIVDADTLLATYTTDENGKIHTDMKLPLMSEGYGNSASTVASGDAISSDASDFSSDEDTSLANKLLDAMNSILPNGGIDIVSDISNASEDSAASGDAISVKTLNSGDYYFKEISVSDSYYKDENPIDIHLEYQDAETKTIEVSKVKENTQTINEISKVDATGLKELAGCDLVLTDKDGNKIVEWTSGDKDSVKVYATEEMGYRNFKTSFDENGNLLIGGLFHDQEYTLTETRPADGYVTAESITYMIKLVMASSVKAELPVNVASGDDISSADASGSAITSGSAVSVTYGSVVAIKNKNGEFEEQSDEKVVMKDEQTHIRLLKLDAKTGQALGGAKFEILDSKGNVVKKLTTIDDDNDLVGLLKVGETYTFKEVSAPEGYKLAKAVKYTVKDTAKVQTVKIKDKVIPDTPDIPQTGGNMPVLPIVLAMIAALSGATWLMRKRSLSKK